MKTIYIIDAKGNLDTRKSDVINRHLKYAESFDQRCGLRGEEGRIVVLGINVNQPSFDSKYLSIVRNQNTCPGTSGQHATFYPAKKGKR